VGGICPGRARDRVGGRGVTDAAGEKPTSGTPGKAPAGDGEPEQGTIMAEDFDYGSFWENARDVLDVLDALSSAMDSLRYLRTSFYLPSHPPAFRRGKRDPQPPDYAERCQRAIDAIRKAASEFFILLAEERFVDPLANVWPPSAPRELTFKILARTCTGTQLLLCGS